MLANREGFEYFHLRQRFSPPRHQASVELTDSGRRLVPLLPLLLLSWGLFLDTSRHSHSS